MRLRFPLLMTTLVRSTPRTHLFDANGERIPGEEGEGPRLKKFILIIKSQLQSAKTYAPMLPLRVAEWPRFKEPAKPSRPKPAPVSIEPGELPQRKTIERGEGKRTATKFLI